MYRATALGPIALGRPPPGLADPGARQPPPPQQRARPAAPARLRRGVPATATCATQTTSGSRRSTRWSSAGRGLGCGGDRRRPDYVIRFNRVQRSARTLLQPVAAGDHEVVRRDLRQLPRDRLRGPDRSGDCRRPCGLSDSRLRRSAQEILWDIRAWIAWGCGHTRPVRVRNRCLQRHRRRGRAAHPPRRASGAPRSGRPAGFAGTGRLLRVGGRAAAHGDGLACAAPAERDGVNDLAGI